MRQRTLVPATLAVLLIGCGAGGSSGSDQPDGSSPSVCADECFYGWWTRVTGDCSALCNLSPQPRECGEPDCQQFEGRELRDDGTFSFVWMTHSPGARSFTVVQIIPDNTWEQTEPCVLRVGDRADGVPVECDAEEIRFPTSSWVRPSTGLEGELDATLAQGACQTLEDCEHSY